MIHSELGFTYIFNEDGHEGVEMRTPRDFAMAGEAELREGESMSVRVEAMRSAMAWILESGPHPAVVIERLVVASLAFVPALVHAMPAADVLSVTRQDAVAREVALMRLLLQKADARAKETRRHSEVIKAALAKAYRREGHTWRPCLAQPTKIEQFRDAVAVSQEESELRAATLARWFRHIWHGRTQLIDALKHFYTIARAYAPELLLNMTAEELAVFFGQGRAAQSDREKRHINKRLARAGSKHTTLRFQKSDAACGKYAEAAKGNHHRAESARIKVA